MATNSINTLAVNLNIYRHYKKQTMLLSLIAFRANNKNPGGCYSSYQAMADELGVTRDTIRDGIRILREDGMIEIGMYSYKKCNVIRLSRKALAMMNGEAADESEAKNEDQRPEGVNCFGEPIVESDRGGASGGMSPAHRGGCSLPMGGDVPAQGGVVSPPPPGGTTPSKGGEIPPQKKEESNIENKKESVCEETRARAQEFARDNTPSPTHTHRGYVKYYNNPVQLPTSLREVIDFAKTVNGTDLQASKFYRHYEATGWTTSSGTPVINWKKKFELWIFDDMHKNSAKNSANSAPAVNPQQADEQNYDDLVNKNDNCVAYVLASNATTSYLRSTVFDSPEERARLRAEFFMHEYNRIISGKKAS